MNRNKEVWPVWRGDMAAALTESCGLIAHAHAASDDDGGGEPHDHADPAHAVVRPGDVAANLQAALPAN